MSCFLELQQLSQGRRGDRAEMKNNDSLLGVLKEYVICMKEGMEDGGETAETSD